MIQPALRKLPGKWNPFRTREPRVDELPTPLEMSRYQIGMLFQGAKSFTVDNSYNSETRTLKRIAKSFVDGEPSRFGDTKKAIFCKLWRFTDSLNSPDPDPAISFVGWGAEGDRIFEHGGKFSPTFLAAGGRFITDPGHPEDWLQWDIQPGSFDGDPEIGTFDLLGATRPIYGVNGLIDVTIRVASVW